MADQATTETTNSTPTTTDPSEQTAATPEPASSSQTTAETQTTEGATLLTAPDGDEDTSQKPETDKGEADPATDPANPEASDLFGAPETYELTLPEGVELDKAVLDIVSPVAKELNLSNAGLTKLAGVYTEAVLPRIEEAFHNQINDQVKETQANWATEAKQAIEADKDLPEDQRVFDGADLKTVRAVAAKTLDRFGGPEFRAFLDETGIGNRVEMLRMAYLVGKSISEETTFPTSQTATAPKSRAERYYGKS
jgi:hypothetical protein